ncbi:sulfurtransferase TusA family protein [Thiomicrorhabdus sp. ZW0627]|uniref:sulfurtransferase TusA family protein n=1 Tax=Thiomicrorhabdus sp. ZW0627 TaxID=3039774 RepID=UPI0024372922|nr:sulfurtransferase TusA family protein [Thiomicrorhabdus sp. ZW0627]MDG6774063.1 sulfurtransferase TusA family protein [Thiomicrorhabdus sp. ZW0627]
MQELDFTGLACPMPIIKLKKFLAESSGLREPFIVVLSDKGGLKDIPAFCQQQKLFCELKKTEPFFVFQIQRVVGANE